jgi:molybdopterin/thiamine biosynthesis adenylyltransferase
MSKRASEDTQRDSRKQQKMIEITADELKLYDRQIRLWGMEAQNRLRNARVLISGITALSNEILKNIVLAGVCHVSLLESAIVSESDLGGQFFLRQEDVGKNVVLFNFESGSYYAKTHSIESSC